MGRTESVQTLSKQATALVKRGRKDEAARLYQELYERLGSYHRPQMGALRHRQWDEETE